MYVNNGFGLLSNGGRCYCSKRNWGQGPHNNGAFKIRYPYRWTGCDAKLSRERFVFILREQLCSLAVWRLVLLDKYEFYFVGAEKFDVVWLHNDKEIKPSKDFHYDAAGEYRSLKIAEIFPEDSGTYTCEVFNDAGEAFSSCTLVVTGKLMHFVYASIFK